VVISKINNLKIVSHLTETEMSLVVWLNIVTIVLLLDVFAFCPPYMREESMPLVNCIVNDDLVNAMPNMQKTLLQFTTLV